MGASKDVLLSRVQRRACRGNSSVSLPLLISGGEIASCSDLLAFFIKCRSFFFWGGQVKQAQQVSLTSQQMHLRL